MPSSSSSLSIIAETERLTLRLFTLNDLDSMDTVLGNPKVMRFSLYGPYSREKTHAFLQRAIGHYTEQGAGLYAVVLKESSTVVGYCGFYFQEIDGSDEWEIGFRLQPDYWGRGLATEAATAVRDYGFGELGRKRFISIIEPENTASIRVAEKCGMRYEKDSVFKGHVSVRIYSVTKTSLGLREREMPTH